MTSHEHSEAEFVELLTEHQTRIHRYVVSMLGSADTAWDVLQETNRVLLEKRSEFQPGTSFVNWALTVAQFQTMAWLRDRGRDRHILTPEIVEQIPVAAGVADDAAEERHRLLHDCLSRLSESHQELIRCRYSRSESLAELSARTGKTINALKQVFFRLRGTLGQCVEQRMVTP